MLIQLRSDEDRNIIEQGFTLIELLVVIVILGILAAVVLFALGGLDTTAKKNSCSTEAATVQTAIAAFKAAHPTLAIGVTPENFTLNQYTTQTQASIMSDLTQVSPANNLGAGTALMQTTPKTDSQNGYWYTTAAPAYNGASTSPYWQIQGVGSASPTVVQTNPGCTQ